LINVNSVVKINMTKVNQLAKAQITALEKTAEALHTEEVQAQVMPRNTGALQNESTFVDYSDCANGKASLVSTVPYARKVYFHPEFNFRKTENANAKGLWHEDWIDGEAKDFCKNAFKEFYRQEGGL